MTERRIPGSHFGRWHDRSIGAEAGLRALFAAACIGFALTGCSAMAPGNARLAEHADSLEKTPAASHVDAQQRLTDALNLIYRDSPLGNRLRYVSTFVDLGGDDRREAVAFVIGPNGCDAGCDLYIFERRGDRYEAISRIPTSKAPVFALDHRHHGWRDLLVSTTSEPNESDRQRMRYDGEGYVPVANKAADNAKRTPLIATLTDASAGHALDPSSMPADSKTP